MANQAELDGGCQCLRPVCHTELAVEPATYVLAVGWLMNIVTAIAGNREAVAEISSRILSVIAQARHVAERGPYHWVRHPLCTGEIASCPGLAISACSLQALAIWLAFCGSRPTGALREERVPLHALPGYGA